MLGSESVLDLPLLYTLIEDITLSTLGLSFITIPANKHQLKSCTKAFVASARRWIIKGEQISLAKLERYQAVHN